MARRFDDDDWEPEAVPVTFPTFPPEPDPADDIAWSSYPHATRGPTPVPDWVVTDPAAVDTDLGVVKTGKEAELSLLRRAVPTEHSDPGRGTRSCLLAAKRYRPADHRLFHSDAAYLEGRRVRKSREMRAMRTRTEVGKQLIADQWAAAEFGMLGRLWSAGAPVPYPVQLHGTEILMEFVGEPGGVAAPRLAETRPTPSEARAWYEQLVEALSTLARLGFAHGDLSAYNVLMHRVGDRDRLVLIDLPQVVDVVGNPQGFEFLRRDCANIAGWFQARGVTADAGALYTHLAGRIT